VTRPLAMDLDAAESRHRGWRFAADPDGIVATHATVSATEVRGDDLADAEAKVTRIDSAWGALHGQVELRREQERQASGDEEGQ
jgi:hypothetical protein